ncbi:MAG: hypothetical protein ACOYL6_03725 [Bacteriovoracaceae bacterium]
MNIITKKISTLSALIFFFVSCSTTKVEQPMAGGVDIVSTAVTEDAKPVIDLSTNPQTDSITPEYVYKKKNKNAHINLHLGPGLYNTFSYVGFFKGLEKNRIKIHALSGVEFGAVMAALYAKHKKSSLVEWELFKLLQQMGSETEVYSVTWKKAISELIQNNFARVDFNQLDIELKIPVWNKDHYLWITEGNVAQALMNSLNLEWSMLNLEKCYKELDLAGIKEEEETLVSVDVLSLNPNVHFRDEHFLHLMKTLSLLSVKAKKISDLYISMKYNSSELDRSSSWQKNNPIAITYGASVAKKVNQLEQTKSVPQ